MSQITSLLSGGASGFVTSLTPDIGVPVTPSGGTITITGYPLTSGGTVGIKTHNGGVANFQIANLDAVTPYMVGTNANTHPFTSIQTAINTAVSDGASVLNPAVVWITPGEYTENLTLQPYVHICAASPGPSGSVVIVGNATFTAAGFFSASNVYFFSNSASSALSIGSASIATIYFYGVRFGSGSSSGEGLACLGSNKNVYAYSCDFVALSGGRNIEMTSSSTINLYNCTSTFVDTPSTVALGNLYISSCKLNDSFSLPGVFSGSIDIYNSFIDSSSSVCFNIGNLGVVTAYNTIMESSNVSGDYATGTGTLNYSNIIPTNPTTSEIDAGLTVGGPFMSLQNLSFDGGITTIDTNGQLIIGNTGSVPVIGNLTSTGGTITVTNGAGTINLETSGIILLNYVEPLDEPYDAISTDQFIDMDTTGAARSVRLPNAPSTGRTFIIKDGHGNAATNNLTITTVGGAVTIDGSTSYVISSNYASIQVIFNGSSYLVF